MTDAAGSAGAGNPGDGGAAPGGEGGAATPVWTEGFSEDQVALVETKGWKGPVDLLTSYQHAEKHIGRDSSTILTIPGPDASDDDYSTLYGRLGRPEKADGYMLAEIEGADEQHDAGLRALAHKMGLSQRQFDQLRAADYQGSTAGKASNDETLRNGISDARKALQNEWGGAFTERDGLASKGAEFIGLSRSAAAKAGLLGGEAGVALMKGLAELGALLVEDKILGQGEGLTQTAAQARDEVDKLKLDKAFMDALLNREHVGHKEAQARWTRLHETAYPDQAR